MRLGDIILKLSSSDKNRLEEIIKESIYTMDDIERELRQKLRRWMTLREYALGIKQQPVREPPTIEPIGKRPKVTRL